MNIIRLEKQIHPRFHDAKWPDCRYVVLVPVNGEKCLWYFKGLQVIRQIFQLSS